MTSIADTSFVVAMMNIDDKWHQACQAIYKQEQEILLPQTTLAEVAYMLRRERGNMQVVSFLKLIPRMKFEITALTDDDIQHTAAILEKYNDTRLDFVDVSIVAIAERLEITHILTLDQRDFRIVQPKHCPYFKLFPLHI
jgi:uncharacterized protein